MAIELGEPLDAARYLVGDFETQKELLDDAWASGDPAYIAHAIGTVARAQGGIAKLAADTGLGRQALHKALSAEGNPRLATLVKVFNALRVRPQMFEIPEPTCARNDNRTSESAVG